MTAARTFQKVSRVPGIPGVNVNLRDLVPGELVVDGRALEHRSPKEGTLRMDPVREISLDQAVVTVTYGEGDAIHSVRFVDTSRGILRSRGASRALVSELQQVFGSATPLRDEEAATLRDETVSELGTALTPIAKRLRRAAWIAGVVTIVAAILLLASIAGEAPFVMSYLLLGITILAAISFARNLNAYRKSHKALGVAQPGEPPDPPPS